MGGNRFYRALHNSKDLVHFNVKVKETDLNIGALRPLYSESLGIISECREYIEDYIIKVPEFLTSLVPLKSLPGAPDIVKDMCSAAAKTGVGPMAAVAGAISQYVGEGLSKISPEIIVENGGDIYLNSAKERIIGVYAGDSPLSNRVGVKIRPEDCPLGICTSSGRVGHSLSLGTAHAVMAISNDAALADGAATALGNMVKTEGDIEYALKKGMAIPGITGVLIIIEDKLGAMGNIDLVSRSRRNKPF